MKNCGNKIKHTCAEKNYATCVYYELPIPTFSELHGEDCTTLEETTEDIYNILGDILGDIDVSALGENCINYNIGRGQVLKIKDVVLQLEQEICDLKDRVNVLETTAICDINITDCGLNLPNNPCGGSFTTLGELLGYLLDNTTPLTP